MLILPFQKRNDVVVTIEDNSTEYNEVHYFLLRFNGITVATIDKFDGTLKVLYLNDKESEILNGLGIDVGDTNTIKFDIEVPKNV